MISEGGTVILVLADWVRVSKAYREMSGNGFPLHIASVSESMISVPSRRKSNTNSMRFTLQFSVPS